MANENEMQLSMVDIQQQIATARQYPRNEIEAIKKTKEIACLTRTSAMNCIYCRPVGKKDGRQQFAEGGSIRLAEILQSKWGNLFTACQQKEEVKPGTVTGVAAVKDLETNTTIVRDHSGSVKTREGYLYSASQQAVVAEAQKQIALRNALFSLISKVVVDNILFEVKKKIMGNEPIESAWKKIVKVFKEMGIDKQQLLQAVAAKNEEELTMDNICRAHGIYNCIRDRVVTKEDCFGKVGKVGKARVSQPKKKGEPEPEQEKEPQTETKPEASEGRKILAEAYETCRKALVENGYTEAVNEISIRFLKAKLPGDPMEVDDKDISGAIDLLSTIATELGGKK